MCTENLQYKLLKFMVPFNSAFDAPLGREPVSSIVVFIAVQTNVARNASRAAATISQYITPVKPNLLWTTCL